MFMFPKSVQHASETSSDRDGLFLLRPSRRIHTQSDFEGQRGDQRVRVARPDPRLIGAGVDELNEALKQAFEEEADHLANARLFQSAPVESCRE